MTHMQSILTFISTRAPGSSAQDIKSALTLCLLLLAPFISSCEGKNGASDQVTGPGTSDSLSGQVWVDPKAARIDTLKARLFDEPDNELLLSDLGDAYFESQRFQEAIPVYEKAVVLDPQNPDVLNDLGLSYFYTGKTEKALDAVNRAIETDPVYKYAWLSKGFILTSTGKYDEASMALGKVKELDPGGQLAKTADGFLREIEISQNRGTEGPN